MFTSHPIIASAIGQRGLLLDNAAGIPDCISQRHERRDGDVDHRSADLCGAFTSLCQRTAVSVRSAAILTVSAARLPVHCRRLTPAMFFVTATLTQSLPQSMMRATTWPTPTETIKVAMECHVNMQSIPPQQQCQYAALTTANTAASSI